MSGSPAPHGRAMLVALTPEAYVALGAREREITRFPYRVGRESRETQRSAHGFATERRDPGSRPTNDLYLRDREEPPNVSREHFAIDRGGSIPLHDRDVIIVRTSLSPFGFKFQVG